MNVLTFRPVGEARYRGLRMSADEYLSLAEDGQRYELVNGVVCMSPSPSYWHQKIVIEIGRQLANYLDRHPIGEVCGDVDVRLGGDLVYQPDVVYLSAEKAARCEANVTEIPDLVVEIISPDSRTYDTQTKRGDYEAAGVLEYWTIDPQRGEFAFWRLRAGRYEAAAAQGEAYSTPLLPDFALDLSRVRRHFA